MTAETPSVARPDREPSRRDGHDFNGQNAGVVSRSVAAAIDGLVVLAVAVGVWLAWSGVLFLAQPRQFTFPSPAPWLGTTFYCLLAVVYLTGAWATSGRPLGSQVMGLRVVDGSGGRLGWARSALRAALCVIFPIGLFWAAVSRRSRSVQDLLIGTSVIYDWTHHAPPRQPAPPAAV